MRTSQVIDKASRMLDLALTISERLGVDDVRMNHPLTFIEISTPVPGSTLRSAFYSVPISNFIRINRNCFACTCIHSKQHIQTSVDMGESVAQDQLDPGWL